MSNEILSEIRRIINEDNDKRIDTKLYATKNIETKVKNCNAKCPKCHKENVYVKTLQLRSADEGGTDIFECLECHYRWKRNN